MLHPGTAPARARDAVEVLGQLGPGREEARGVEDVLGAQLVAPVGQRRGQVAAEPVVHDVVRRHLLRREPLDDRGQGSAAGGAPVGVDLIDGEAGLAQAVGEATHARAVQDQLVGVEAVLPEEQVVLDQDEDGAGRGVQVLDEELVRQHQP
uniref:hypothetical protein n=1 Tax=uncultured Nocardioides sp. TaxID=198441 RepID=UPI0030F68DC7